MQQFKTWFREIIKQLAYINSVLLMKFWQYKISIKIYILFFLYLDLKNYFPFQKFQFFDGGTIYTRV